MNHVFRIETHGPACHEFTHEIAAWLGNLQARDGVLTLMVRHTSCSLLVQENADPDVQVDLLNWLDRIAPPADHPTMGLPVSLQIPVVGGRMQLGTWQGIYLVEHRRAPHRRQVAAMFQSA